MFALGRARLVNAAGAGARRRSTSRVSALGGALFGVDGVVGAFFVVPLAFAVVLLCVGAGRGAPGARARAGPRRPALRAGSGLSFGVGACVAAAVDGIAVPLLTLGIGSVLYGSLGLRLAPEQVRLLLGAVRPAST